MKAYQHQRGFGVLGMALVMLVVGAAALLLPRLLLSKNTQSTQLTDLQALQTAKTAVISDALSKGVLPAVGAVTAACPNGSMPATLGVNNWGVFGKENSFCMDVNAALKSPALTPSVSTPGSSTTVTSNLCVAARSQLTNDAAAVLPRSCKDTTCAAPAFATSTPVAFVIYSTGADRSANQANAVSANRIYENDLRGINNAPEAIGSTHYDDQVVSYPLAQLVKDCATVPVPPLPVATCGNKFFKVTTSGNQKIYYSNSVAACNTSSMLVVNGPATSLVFGPLDTCSLQLYRSNCSSPINTGNYKTNGDSNADGTVVISCTDNGSNSSCDSL